MVIVVCDTNIFIDIEAGNLTRPMFRMDETFATPDILYREELEEHHPELPGLGLRIERLGADGVQEVERLATTYSELSINDLFALSLAIERKWPLLSGDKLLRETARAENVEIHGTLWIVEQMVSTETIQLERARTGFCSMRTAGRRLPWKDVDELLGRLEGGA